jgi:polyisoprenoid-binding protein YceI
MVIRTRLSQPTRPAPRSAARGLGEPRFPQGAAAGVPVMLAATVLALMALSAAGSVARAAPVAYRIDSAQSAVLIFLERRGPLSVLAHDHVLVVGELAGRLEADREHLAATTLRLSVPVAELRVDPPQERERAGMSSSLSDEDRASVRGNLLSPAQLDAERYPQVSADLAGVSGELPHPTLALHLHIRGIERTIPVPVDVKWGPEQLRVRGELALLQSDFGIRPYSTLLGAIAVKDQVRIRFDIVAVPETP